MSSKIAEEKSLAELIAEIEDMCPVSATPNLNIRAQVQELLNKSLNCWITDEHMETQVNTIGSTKVRYEVEFTIDLVGTKP